MGTMSARCVTLTCAMATVMLVGCTKSDLGDDEPRDAVADATHGAVTGTFTPARAGETIMLCRVTDAGDECDLTTHSDKTNRNGAYAISKVTPGHYLICHAGRGQTANVSPGQKLPFSYRPTGKISGKFRQGAWITTDDIPAGPYVVKKGAEMSGLGGGGRPFVSATLSHMATGLSIELRDSYKFLLVKVESGVVTTKDFESWTDVKGGS